MNNKQQGSKALRQQDAKAARVLALMIIALCGLLSYENSDASPSASLKQLKTAAYKKHDTFMVAFKGNVLTTGKIIYLKDVADVLPPDAGGISLGAAPLPGTKRIIEKESVLMLLKKNYGSSIKVVFKGAGKAVIVSQSFEVSRNDVENFLKKSLSEIFGRNEEDVSVEIVSFPSPLLLPSDKYELRVPVKKLKLSSFLSVPVEVVVGESVYRRMVCGVKLHVYGKVYAVSKPFLKGDLFSGDAVVAGTDDIARLPYDIVTDPASLLNKVAKENIAEGSVLRESSFVYAKIVHTGDELEILGKVGDITVTAKGRALQDGKIGDVIRVENVDSKKFVHAKILSSVSVEVVLED